MVTPLLLLCFLCGAAGAALPFSYSLDQSVPCPVGSGQDSLLAAEDGGRPLALGDDAAVDAALAALPAFLQQKLGQLGCPSAGVIVTHNGAVLGAPFVGSSRLNGSSSSSSSPRPLDLDSGFMIASISKTFASTTLFMLRDRGLLPQGLDTPAADVLPTFAVQPPRTTGASTAAPPRSRRPITLRALAMQVSGLPREPPYPAQEPIGPAGGNATVDALELRVLAALANLTQLSPAWSQPHYSNLGLALVGRAVGNVVRGAGTHAGWEAFVREELLAKLNMSATGNPSDYVAGEGARARLVDGAVSRSARRPVPVAMADHWSGPAGSMHSSLRDMGTWMSFLMDVGTDAQRAAYAAVLATRAEMRGSGFLMGDGASAVGAATFEEAFVRGRWAVSKLGCVDGYRSALTMVPSLGLGVFGVATSTCDLHGDGDAITFPVASSLLQPVERALAARAAAAQAAVELPPAAALAGVTGRYCSSNRSEATVLAVEQLLPGDGGGHGGGATAAAAAAAAAVAVPALVSRPAPGVAGYSFVLRYVGDASATHGAGATEWRRIMGPEKWLNKSFPGCEPGTARASGGGGDAGAAAADAAADDDGGGDKDEGLCSISCMRKLARGSGEPVYFYTQTQGPFEGHVIMDNPGAGESCARFESFD